MKNRPVIEKQVGSTVIRMPRVLICDWPTCTNEEATLNHGDCPENWVERQGNGHGPLGADRLFYCPTHKWRATQDVIRRRKLIATG